MNYEVYCDESGIEALFDKNAHKYTVIGGIWIPKEYRDQLKKDLNEIKHRFNVWGEIKWNKISPAYLDLYKEVISLFLKSPKIRFRAIIINSANVNHDKYNNGCGELGFYKFYYELIYHWLNPNNVYDIFVDYKVNGYKYRINELEKILRYSNNVNRVQALPSHESVAIQLADILTGSVASKFNEETVSQAKLEVRDCIEQYKPIKPTSKGENKFNIFDIHLRKGW